MSQALAIMPYKPHGRLLDVVITLCSFHAILTDYLLLVLSGVLVISFRQSFPLLLYVLNYLMLQMHTNYACFVQILLMIFMTWLS